MPTPPYSRLPTSQAEEGLLIPCIKGPKKHDKVPDIVPPQLLEALEQANSGTTPSQALVHATGAAPPMNLAAGALPVLIGALNQLPSAVDQFPVEMTAPGAVR